MALVKAHNSGVTGLFNFRVRLRIMVTD